MFAVLVLGGCYLVANNPWRGVLIYIHLDEVFWSRRTLKGQSSSEIDLSSITTLPELERCFVFNHELLHKQFVELLIKTDSHCIYAL